MLCSFFFATSLSNMFINVFIWKLNSSLSLLALYSLVFSLVILASFPLCAVFARKRTPMASSRLGILCFLATYALVLLLQERSADHIFVFGLGLGLGASFFAIGMHMGMLDSTRDRGRDCFLFVSNLLNSVSGMLAPLLSGFLIDRFTGMTGYYFVFSITLIWFLIAIVFSMQ